jgi:hypothetical protein
MVIGLRLRAVAKKQGFVVIGAKHVYPPRAEPLRHPGAIMSLRLARYVKLCS